MREHTFILEENPAPLVVVDFMVAGWDIFALIKKYDGIFSEEVKRKIVRACWALKINRGPDMLPMYPYRLLIVSDKRFEDTKMYWRGVEVLNDVRISFLWEDYCEKRGKDVKSFSQAYKGNRVSKNDGFYQIIEEGWDYVTTYFPSFRTEGFEADDWAGAIYRISKYQRGVCHDRQILLSTVDRDWSGLVDESEKIFWANTRKPRPNELIQERLVGEDGVVFHTKHKLKMDITNPLEIYHAKHIYGELGDNLPPGAPIEYIDLSLPHPTYQVEKLPDYPNLITEVNNPNPNVRTDHYESARKALRKLKIGVPW
jgi:hypothetical protein